ncbi:MAG: 50S ribosomal protein L25 [Proteobacteria bacterium]|nr:50S ribosomal protein L25 [Desulfobacterales bacterium]MBL6968349.1 50S ribosomal protein L25 [Desulfobacteraceae bacterium]MBU0736289.1 50S ribosomal protein L25 [Pseudomonadota bacterium]MBL7102239.1 50S ribosomal protein L25 [Desulfobacteraceae bacterium]MBL7171942.1 50S ribosomal protein L25 [Desulfobacteraceae bacterium]
MRQITLGAQVRERTGKGAARKLRKSNQIPAIFYGPGSVPIMLAVDYIELERMTKLSGAENIILDLQVKSEQGEQTKRVMLKELTVDPVKNTYLHADFYEISMDKEITVDIPVRLMNTPIGVTNGGFLQHVRRELTVSCLPGRLIDAFDIDVYGLDIGDSIHIRDIKFPEGIRCEEEDHLTVAVVSAPGGGVEEEEVPEEEVEVETAVSEKDTAEES